uniref:Uncharacterized protein n=1 Tax=Anguilla anguilla TaxID=7936 RepID=A0A0E9XJC6_ANGAN
MSTTKDSHITKIVKVILVSCLQSLPCFSPLLFCIYVWIVWRCLNFLFTYIIPDLSIVLRPFWQMFCKTLSCIYVINNRFIQAITIGLVWIATSKLDTMLLCYANCCLKY